MRAHKSTASAMAKSALLLALAAGAAMAQDVPSVTLQPDTPLTASFSVTVSPGEIVPVQPSTGAPAVPGGGGTVIPGGPLSPNPAESSTLSPIIAPSPTTAASPPPPPPSPSSSTVVEIFYINTRLFMESGVGGGPLPYSLLHSDSGSVLGVDESATTFVITTTRVLSPVSLPPRATSSPVPTVVVVSGSTVTVGTPRPTLSLSMPLSTTGQPSTVTQGPSTYMYTGPPAYGPTGYTIVNRCRLLNGTKSARCNLTHVGAEWYTGPGPFATLPGGTGPDGISRTSSWNGTYRTYSYNWTEGDRFGFAPVTVTAGLEKLPPPGSESSTSTNAAPAGWAAPPTVAVRMLFVYAVWTAVMVAAGAAGVAVVF